VGPPSLKIEAEGDPFGAPRPVLVTCVLQARVVIPMATKDCFGFMSHMQPTRLHLSTASPALSALTVLLRGRHFVPQVFTRNQSRHSETVWALTRPAFRPPSIHEEPVPPFGDGVGNLRAHARMLGRVST
jgi:hypothetical protein